MPKSIQSAVAKTLTELILEVFRLNGRLVASGDQLTRKFGQSSSKWQVLGALEQGPLTVVRIADFMGLTRQSVQRTADLLVGRGLCRFEENPHHRRSKLVSLTEKGNRILGSISSEQIRWSNGLGGYFSKKELREGLGAISKLRKRLEQGRRQEDKNIEKGS